MGINKDMKAEKCWEICSLLYFKLVLEDGSLMKWEYISLYSKDSSEARLGKRGV